MEKQIYGEFEGVGDDIGIKSGPSHFIPTVHAAGVSHRLPNPAICALAQWHIYIMRNYHQQEPERVEKRGAGEKELIVNIGRPGGFFSKASICKIQSNFFY